MTMTNTPVDNGVNTEALLGARQALSEAPEAAAFTWRSSTRWVHGTHSTSTIEGFSGLGTEHRHQKTFTFEADHPGFHYKSEQRLQAAARQRGWATQKLVVESAP